MPLDPQVKALLDQMAAVNAPPIETLTVVEARAQSARRRAIAPPGPDLPGIEDRAIPGPAGTISVRIYRPAEGVLPGVVHFHGGGWITGGLDAGDAICRHLAKGSGCAIIAIDYRLAPEHPFPAAPEDCYAATRWVAENASNLGVQPGNIAVAGESSGGNLAAAVCLMARDRGGPAIAYQVLVCPVTDSNFETPSYRDNGTGYSPTRAGLRWFWDQYVPAQMDRQSPYAAPLRADSLSSLPPALVITAEYDPLRDEGEAYAEALRSAGVPVKAHRYDGVTHGFIAQGHVVDKGQQAMAEVAKHLREALSVPAQ